MTLRLLYRGSLVSCNYGCDYCPFAKRKQTPAEQEQDRRELERFVCWCAGQTRPLGVLFTPWGEGLVRPWYQEALVALSNLPHVERVAIQTNLSARLDWVPRCDLETLGLWATYHPTQVTRARFLARCGELDAAGARYSVGVVGLREHFDEIRALRDALPAETYLWVNAYKRQPGYYTPEEVAWLTEVDPHFPLNNVRHATRGHACRTGQSVLSVDGEGTLRRCHFVPQPLGNLYEPDWESALQARPCPTATCGCFIGYVHLERLALEQTFGPNVLERITMAPASVPRR
jgi:MoaA/NifB/PqqE/SkfB family radical SAM enzyme